MTHHKKIEELLNVSSLNKKRVDLLVGEILANICFEILNNVSEYIYKERSNRQAEYTSFCESIFTNINISIKNARKCKTFEEYNNKIMYPVFEVLVLSNNIANKHAFIQNNKKDPELLVEFKKENEKIYKKFFKKTSRKRKVKANGIQ